jgi:hypothetical protein
VLTISQLTGSLATSRWAVESTYQSATIPTMLNPTELQMLEWICRNYPLSEDAIIVDAGSFLGGSTAAMAAGLAANKSNLDKSGLIHAYDLFTVPQNLYSRQLIGERPLGTSVLDIFETSLAPNIEFVTTHKGDFNLATSPEQQIEILLVDIAKSWSLNHVMVTKFFRQLKPGKSIVIQQDHNDQTCPWVNVTMEYFCKYFEYLADDNGSRIYLNVAPIPSDLLTFDLSTLPLDQKIDLALKAARRSKHPVSEYLSLVSVAWLFRERGDSAALAFLEGLPPQPWVSDEPYLNKVKQHLSV